MNSPSNLKEFIESLSPYERQRLKSILFLDNNIKEESLKEDVVVGYSNDLEAYSTSQLKAELRRRKKSKQESNSGYPRYICARGGNRR